MKSLKRWIRNYFSFTQRETNGFILLLVVMGGVVLLPFLWDQFQEPYNPAADQQTLDSLATQLKAKSYEPYQREQHLAEAKPIPPEFLRPFDPNSITQAQWEQLGLPAYVAKRLLKYRDAANGFTYKGQLKKIYGFPAALYAQLEPYMQLPDEKPARTFTYRSKNADRAFPDYTNKSRLNVVKKNFRVQPFDINTADSTQLKKIRGIGSKLSARIVKFRDKLGGFGSIDQLQEVYGLPAEVVDSLRKYSFVGDSFEPSKFNINSATLEQLRQHPYIGNHLARQIVAYRTQHGPFQTLDDLLKIKTMDAATLQKIRPYLAL